MKIRRIDQNEVLNYAQKHRKIMHKPSNSQLFNTQQFPIFIKSERASLQIKILKDKIITRKQKKKQNHASSQDSLKILAIYQKIKFLYNKLTSMYSTNQNKLTSLLVKHIKVQYYIFSKQILEMIRNFRLYKQNLTLCYHSQPKKIIHQLTKFKQFLESFYQKKCLKQIQIIQDNLLQRQEAIRYNTPFQRYKRITKSFRPSLITNNIDISQEFKQMSAQNGGFRQLSKVQNSLFKKLRQTQHKISKVFTSVCNSKQKDIFLFKVQELS